MCWASPLARLSPKALLMGELFDSYARSLKGTFTSELLFMNFLMGGMMSVSIVAFAVTQGAHNRSQPIFWFHVSFVLMVGAAFAHLLNWWLVAHHL
jgi:hypothetical protein